MTSDFRAAVLHGPRDLRLERVPMPRLKPSDVLVRVTLAGICGSDLHRYMGDRPAAYPVTPGHECVGEVVQVGDGVGQGLLGARVVVRPIVACGKCANCSVGADNLCPMRRNLGTELPGTIAEYCVMPERCVYRVDSPVSDLAALLIEPFAAALRGVRKLGACTGLRGLIFGAGPMGLLTVVAARLAGAVVDVVDPKTDRLSLAAELGARATYPGVAEGQRGKFDFVVETAGVPVAVEQAIQAVRPGGTVVFLGLCTGTSNLAEIDIARRELVVVGSVLYSRWEFGTAVSLASQGALDAAASMVTHVLPLDEATEAFKAAELQQAVKVAVRGWEA